MSTLSSLAVAMASIPALAGSGYLALLAVSARKQPNPAPTRARRFAVIVPAHNEAAGIEATVLSLLSLDYPAEQFRVVVVADNCTDETAAIARSAGAHVLTRVDADKRGKGFALMFAYNTVIDEAWADAVVVVDADTVVSKNLLGAVDARFAAGWECAQAEYGVRNSGDSWRTRLMSLAFTLHHTLRSLGRDRLGVSCGLRGNGMGFTVNLLQRVPHQSTSLVEDVEYGIVLGLAGVPVAYVPEATVLGEMPASEEASRTQRDRWERGRRILVRTWTGTLLRASAGGGGALCLDLVADLLLPPLISVAAFVAIGSLIAVLLWSQGWVSVLAVAPWLLSTLMLGLYVMRGCALSATGWRVLGDLCWVPLYAFWKISLRFRRHSRDDWVRTARTSDATERAIAKD